MAVREHEPHSTRRRALRHCGLALWVAGALVACDAGAPEPPETELPLAAAEDRLMDGYLAGLGRATEILSRVRDPEAEPAAAAELETVIAELGEILEQLGATSEDFKQRHLERYFEVGLKLYQERRRIEDDPELGELLEPLLGEVPTPE